MSAPAKTKTMVYLPPEVMADMDDLRNRLRRDGVVVNRSALIALAWGWTQGEDREDFVAFVRNGGAA